MDDSASRGSLFPVVSTRPVPSRATFSIIALLLGVAFALPVPKEALASNLIGSFETEIQQLCDQLRKSVACVEARQSGKPVLVGAGVIADSAGFVVTTASVVRGADSVRVRIVDRGELSARVVGTDPITNLALLHVEGGGFAAAPFATSTETAPGSWVMILGNSYGAGPTVSVGILSGRRPCSPCGEGQGLLQVNAPVNPGDSGGALVNSRGEVIGIVCAALTPRETAGAGSLVGAQGDGRAWGSGATVGFAVPIRAGRSVIEEIRAKGRVVRGFLGLEVRALSEDEKSSAVLAGRPGLLVTNVMAEGPAERAGFQIRDIILTIDGEAIDTPRRLQKLVERSAPQARLSVSVLRAEATQEIAVVVEEMPFSFAEKHRAQRVPLASDVAATSPEGTAQVLQRIDALESELQSLRALLGTAQAPPRQR